MTRLGLTLIACACLASCALQYRDNMRPVTWPSNKARPKPVVYKQCDKEGCRIYDSQGRRRHDLERPYAN